MTPGVPGAGKSTIARMVVKRLNELGRSSSKEDVAVLVPMDGFHYTKMELDAMPNPEVVVH